MGAWTIVYSLTRYQAMMEKVEYLCTAFNSIKLKDLNERLQKASVAERPSVVSQTVVKHKEDEQAKPGLEKRPHLITRDSNFPRS